MTDIKMDCIEILRLLSDELKKQWETTENFNNWVPVQSNVVVRYNCIDYCIDYDIIAPRKIRANLTTYQKKHGKWVVSNCEAELKQFIENSFNMLLPLWYVQLEKDEEQKELEKEALQKDYYQMQATYDSLYISER